MLDTRQASTYLAEEWGIKQSPRTLANKRSTGGGPRYHRAGLRALYSESDLDSYAQQLLGEPANSTTEERSRGVALPTGAWVQEADA